MIKIGYFARLGAVSVATLRHYDELGLLKPAHIDSFSGYRYYTVEQLALLNRILALKELGFSLDQIQQILHDGLTREQLRTLLEQKRAEVAQRIAEEQARLQRIDVRLCKLHQEDRMPSYDVVVKTTAAQLVLSKRIVVPTNDQVPAYLDKAYAELGDYAARNGVKQIGPNLTLWYTPSDVFSNEEVEVAIPIDRSLPSQGDLVCRELPSVEVAAAVHQGEFAQFQQLYPSLLSWISDHGYQINGPSREIYIHHDCDNLQQSTTEVQFPIVSG